MRFVLTLSIVLLATSCAEVTVFKGAESGDLYLIDCGSTMRLFESCQSAMSRTCRGGFEFVGPPPRTSDGQESDARLFRCQAGPALGPNPGSQASP